MALQTIQTVNHPGIDLTALAVAADGASGDSWVNTGAQMVAVINGSASPITVTLPYVATFDGQTPPNKTLSVPANHTAIVGPFNPAYYNQTSNQQAKITYSAVTSVSVCVFQMGS